MASVRDPDDELDERLQRLGRQWFAEVRQKQRWEESERAPPRREGDGDAADIRQWLFGDGDGDDD